MAQFFRRAIPRLWHGAIRRQGTRDGLRRFGQQEQQEQQPQGTFSRLFMFAAGAAGLGGIFVATHLERTPISNRLRFVVMSPEAEEQLGEAGFKEVLAQYEGKVYSPKHPAVIRVERIATQLIQRTPLRNQPWTFHVVHSPDKNCFVLPGRHVFVFDGILPILDTDDALAAVLGHEIAHLYARHAAERMSLRYLMMGLVVLVGISGIDISPIFRDILLSVGLELPFSRKMESEADYIGLHLMSECCYDPAAAPLVFERMEEANTGSKPPKYLSTHPPNPIRIKQLEEWLPEMRAVQRKNRCDELGSLNEYFMENFGVNYR